MYGLIWNQRTNGRFCPDTNKKKAIRWAQLRFPTRMKESAFNLKQDKIFASDWISDTSVLAGTKDNKLLFLDHIHNNVFEIPLIETDKLQNPRELENKPLECVQDGLLLCDPLSPSPQSRFSSVSGCQGIRCVATSPNGCYVAVALADPAVVMIYRLPTMRGVAIAKGHRDAVFSVVWIDNDRFMTGSRDGSLRVWSVNDAMEYGTNGVGHTIKWLRQSWTSSSRPTTSKVRDLKLIECNGTRTATSLTSKGTVQLWDINTFQRKNIVKLPFTQELVCLSVQPNRGLIAVGSQAHITFADPRQAKCAQSFDSQDGFWGVRSLAFGSEHILTCGGGRGRLSFIDTRMMEFLPLAANNDTSVYHNSSSEGWLDRESQMYKSHFTGIQIPPAIYTTAYNPDGTKLFTAGGPIQSGLRGCYAALWF
ncbi:WD40-repeat-containing domain protein [Phycomyces nitens]|nr:WD40-repeat-containing domain protein [Phycomyces nitens]